MPKRAELFLLNLAIFEYCLETFLAPTLCVVARIPTLCVRSLCNRTRFQPAKMPKRTELSLAKLAIIEYRRGNLDFGLWT